jgi:predicted metal-dependent hydrolase
LNAKELDAAGAHPVMLDLLRWHGAEEVEHRSVAYNLFMHLDGRYRRRVRNAVVVVPVLLTLFARGVRFLMENDPETINGKSSIRKVLRAGREGLLPSFPHLILSTFRFVKLGYHPSQEGSTAQAVAYLATSPSATAAEA